MFKKIFFQDHLYAVYKMFYDLISHKQNISQESFSKYGKENFQSEIINKNSKSICL